MRQYKPQDLVSVPAMFTARKHFLKEPRCAGEEPSKAVYTIIQMLGKVARTANTAFTSDKANDLK